MMTACKTESLARHDAERLREEADLIILYVMSCKGAAGNQVLLWIDE
jgi:hypothetical protein